MPQPVIYTHLKKADEVAEDQAVDLWQLVDDGYSC